MPTAQEQVNQAGRLNQQRNDEMQAKDRARQTPAPPQASFPWGMLAVAIIFDLVGLIPIVNIATEIFAGFIFWMWQKEYVPSLDPLVSIAAAKLFKLITFGILPDNIGVVIYAYFKKKAAAKIKTPMGKLAAKAA